MLCLLSKYNYGQISIGPMIGFKTLFLSEEANNILELPQKNLLSPSVGLIFNYDITERVCLFLGSDYSSYYISGIPVSMLFDQPSGMTFKIIQNQMGLKYNLSENLSIGPIFVVNSIFDHHFTISNYPISDYRKLSKFPSGVKTGAGVFISYSREKIEIFISINNSFDLYGELFDNDNYKFFNLGMTYNFNII